jgi:PAS domain S-box-containing protein
MLGRDPGDIEGKPIVDIMGDEGFSTIRPHVDRVLDGQRVEYESDVSFASVGIRSLRVVYTPDRDIDGEIVGWIASILDVTDHRGARDAHALVTSIVDSSVDAIVTKDLDGNITSWNAAAHQLFGYSADEMIGKPIRTLIPPERQSEEDDILARLRQGERIDHFETVRIAKDGRRLDISVTISPLRNASGAIIGASKIARDISALKAAAAELQKANRLKDEFLASLSHELRTPLNAILGYSRMLRTGMLPPDRQEKAIETIERNATSLTQIVEDVLDVSRIVSGKIRLNVQPVDFPEIVRNAIEAVTPAADAKNIRIEAVIDPHAAPIAGDPERLQQILWNLLSNAVKFTGKAGKVQVRLGRVNSHVELSVSDTGVGISPEFLPHVFERFRQADAGIARERGGLGLGLSIARHLTEMHGGTIEAASGGVGQGATFRLKMPLMIIHAVRESTTRVHPRSPSRASAISVVDLEKVHILAVDDDADALSLVAEVLEAAGARVSTARSAEDALRQVSTEVPNVLIADLGMPHVDGFQLIEQVRRHRNPLVRAIPAAALTAYARSDDRVKALRAGFQIHLAKPIDPAELVTTIAALAKRFTPEAPEGEPEPSA